MSFQIRQTQYNDPDQTSGMHTNGPANIFIREDDSCPWYQVPRTMNLYKVRKLVAEIGLTEFQLRYCVRIVD